MTRDIERGTRGISTLLSYFLFSIIPVILEFALVAAVLIHKFDWRFAAVTFGAVAIYITFTVLVTGVAHGHPPARQRARLEGQRARHRQPAELRNGEVFGNEEFEARRYEENLQGYEAAAVKNEASLGLLNIGQSLIIAIAVTALMLLVAQGVAAQSFTLGDLVLVNGLLIQLYIRSTSSAWCTARSSRRCSTWTACFACSTSIGRSRTAGRAGRAARAGERRVQECELFL